MSATEQDVRALEHLANRIREDTHGCKTWDAEGTHVVFARELTGMNLLIAIETVVHHAADPDAKTPAAIKRPFLPDIARPEKRYPAPKKPDECRKHPGQYADNCATCITEPQRAYNDPTEPVATIPADEARKLARATAAEPMRAKAPTLTDDRKEA